MMMSPTLNTHHLVVHISVCMAARVLQMQVLLVGLASSNLCSLVCERVPTATTPTPHHNMPCTRIPCLFHPSPGTGASHTQAHHKHACYFHTP